MDGLTIGAVVAFISFVSGLLGLMFKIKKQLKEDMMDQIKIGNSSQDAALAALKAEIAGLKKQEPAACQVETISVEDQRAMMQQVKELHEWHSVTDGDGVKLWYVRRSLEDAIERLSDNISQQTRIFDRLVLTMERNDKHKHEG